jgi:NADP-dependent 3-hydroxy acid dehydrogenase YdfG
VNALIDKIAIIAGASSGIGEATAKLFAAQGAKLVLGARRLTELQRVRGEIASAGGDAVALQGDVRDESYAQALVETASIASAVSISALTMPADWGRWRRGRRSRSRIGERRSMPI